MQYHYHNPFAGNRRHSKYAVVLFLPEHLNEVVAPLRESYDPDYSLVPPHVTIVFPFNSDRPMDELAAVIKAESDQHSVIELLLGKVEDFYPAHPIIYWSVDKNEALNKLYSALTVRLGSSIIHEDYKPHVTIAREISNHRVMLVKDKIISYLPVEKVSIDRIDLITPLGEQRWVSVRTFPLTARKNP